MTKKYEYQQPKFTHKQEQRMEEEVRMHRLIHSYYKTAGKYPLITQMCYYGFLDHDIYKIFVSLSRKGLISLENKKIVSHVKPKGMK